MCSSHWPDCNWCGKGSQQIAQPNATQSDSGDESSDSPYEDYDPYVDDNGSALEARSTDKDDFLELSHRPPHHGGHSHRGMRRVRRSALDHHEARDVDLPVPVIDDPPASVPVQPPPIPGTTTSQAPTTTKGRAPASTAPPAQNAGKPGKKTDKASKCTPSPTKSLAPSASE